ncbi:MAG: tetraacyldisaccharide 4'-kinase [Flavobacteriaceae bacterium]
MKLVRFLLFPFAILYDLITSIRNFFFDTGVFKSTSFNFPVIAVGNLSVGGTGKSPQIEYLIRLLKNKNIAVLSRGYGRKTKEFVLINPSHTADDVGDEPLQFFTKFKNIPVAVDTNRVAGIRRLKKEINPAFVLLDDAFQHRKVKAGYYILLTKYNDLYSNDFLLPTGNLREARRGAKRANVILVTKCPEDLSKQQQEHIIKEINPLKNQQVFFTYISYGKNLKGNNPISIEKLAIYEVVLVTGIANPTPLLNFLDSKKVSYQHLKFPDHHHFSQSDLGTIHNAYNKIKAEKKILLTTEKDYMRLSNKINEFSYITIETQFIDNKDVFDKKILEFIVV